MNEKPTKEVKTLPVITKFIMTIGELPTSYLMSMTYLEQVTWLCNYLEKTIIPALNQNGEAVKELQELYELLRTYVNEYFDNLDIQTEVNNKLDEMAESGQLTEIIAQYLDLAGVLAYNTIAELKAATNIVAGSICYTLGQNTYNDGKGAFYKIRNVTTDDVIDNFNIVSITNDNTIVGERLPDYYINQVNTRIDNINNKKILFIGDSYLSMFNGSTGVVDKFKIISGETNVIVSVYGGTGFAYTVDNKNFITLLNDVADDSTLTDIIVAGGYNDQYSNQADVLSAINTFCQTAKTKFPKAKIYIGMVGFTLESAKRFPIFGVYQTYVNCSKYGAIYLNGVENIMHDTSLFIGDTDLTHPNEEGRIKIAQGLYQAWKNGYYSTNRNYVTIPFTYSGDATSGNLNLTGMIIDNKTYYQSQGNRSIYFANRPNYSDIHNVDIEIGTLTLNQNGSILSPWPYNMYSLAITCAVRDNSGYRTMNGIFKFINDKIYIHFEAAETSNWTDINGLIEIEINPFQGTFPTQMI